MKPIIRLALAILATYRFAQLFTLDEGPGKVLLHLREQAGSYDYDETGHVKTSLGTLMGCPYCFGLYASVLFTVLVALPSTVGDLFLIVLGLAGGQAYLQGPREAA